MPRIPPENVRRSSNVAPENEAPLTGAGAVNVILHTSANNVMPLNLTQPGVSVVKDYFKTTVEVADQVAFHHVLAEEVLTEAPWDFLDVPGAQVGDVIVGAI